MESFCDLVNLENVEFLDRTQIGEDTRLRLLIGCPEIYNVMYSMTRFVSMFNTKYKIEWTP